MSEPLPFSWRRPLRHGLVKNTFALISGTVVTQAIIFLASPILARIFGLEEFGDLANFNAWVAVLALLSNLRYEHAIIVANGRKQIGRVLTLSGLLSLGSCGVYLLIAIGIRLFAPDAGYVAHLKRIVLLIPLGTLAVCCTSIFAQLSVKTGRFKRLATISAAQLPFTLVPQIVLGRFHIAHALIIGTIMGYVASSAIFFWHFLREERLSRLRRALPHLRATAGAHRDFPRYALPADAITVVAQQFIPVFILALFNPAIAGLYAFSVRVVRVPMIVVSTAVAGALRKEASDRVIGGRSLTSLFTGTLRTMALFSLVPFLVVLLYAEPLFRIVFGERWEQAGHVAQILSPGILSEFIALPLAVLFLVTRTQRYTLAIQAVGFVLLVLGLVAGKHLLGDFISTCYVISAVMVVVNAASVLLAGRAAGISALRAPVRVL